MLTSKQRTKLRSLASTTEPIGQIGKSGVTDNLVESVDKALTARELIKHSVLKGADETPEFYADELAERIGAEVVCVIGKKLVLYRKSEKEHVEHNTL